MIALSSLSLRQFSRRSLVLSSCIVLTVVVLGIAWTAYSQQEQYVTTTVQRGDMHQTVEAVGTVISENDLGLQFRSSGIVSEVNVHEGDAVLPGQRLAALRAGDIGAGVAAAAARAREAEAALRALQEGTRPEEIAIAEAQLDSKRMSLDSAKTVLNTAEENLAASQAKLSALKQEADTALSGQVAMAGTVASQKLTTAEQALGSIDDVYNTYDVSDVVTTLGSSSYSVLREQLSAAKFAIVTVKREPNPPDYRTALSLMDEAHVAVQKSVDTLSIAYDFLVSLPETRALSREDKETYKNTLAAKRSIAQSTLTELDTWVKSLKDDSAVYDTRIATEESTLAAAKGTKEKAEADIRSYESAIRIDEANLALKRAGPRQTDIDAAQARWQAARADTARASASYIDTQIIAPIAGRITKVSITAGEMAPTGPAITMIGESPYRIEALLSEADVLKVQRSQSGAIELDAVAGTSYQLIVSEIDESPTVVNGQQKYRIKLDFLYPHTDFKIGMSGDLTIQIAERHNALLVPVQAVASNGEQTTVRTMDARGRVTEVPVVTGIRETSTGMIEIISGLQEGDAVILSQQ